MNDEETRKVVKEAVHETLTSLGFTVTDIHSAQADLLYLRQLRTGSEDLKRRVKNTIITVLIPTMLYLFWESIKNNINKMGPL